MPAVALFAETLARDTGDAEARLRRALARIDGHIERTRTTAGPSDEPPPVVLGGPGPASLDLAAGIRTVIWATGYRCALPPARRMSAAPSLPPLDLRRAAARFPKGVALVTAPGGLALVVDSFISVSLEPPLIAISPSRGSLTWRRMRKTGRFGVNVLGAGHAADIRERARPAADRLAGLAVDVNASGVPVLRDALAFLDCALDAEHVAGDHTIAIGRVLAARLGAEEPPLVGFGGGFGTFAPANGSRP